MNSRIVFILICSLFLVAEIQGQTKKPTIDSVDVSLKFSELPTRFSVFHWQDDTAIYRALKGDADDFSFTDFRKCKLAGADQLVDRFLKLALKKRGLGIENVGQLAFHGVTVRVVVKYSYVRNKEGDFGKVSKTFDFSGLSAEFVFRELWSKFDGESEIVKKQIANIGDSNYRLLSNVLKFSHSSSSAWVPHKCVLTIGHIREGKSDASNWSFPIAFDKKVSPLMLSYLIDFHSNLADQPYGIISFGDYYGHYEISTKLSENDIAEKPAYPKRTTKQENGGRPN